MAKMGRPQEISDQDISDMFQEMAEGYTFKQVVEKHGHNYSSLIRRVVASDHLSKLHARAREEFAHTCVQKLFDIADQEEDVQRARLKCDNVKWYAARVLPKDYGDKTETTLKGDKENPVVLIDAGANPYQVKR